MLEAALAIKLGAELVRMVHLDEAGISNPSKSHSLWWLALASEAQVEAFVACATAIEGKACRQNEGK